VGSGIPVAPCHYEWQEQVLLVAHSFAKPLPAEIVVNLPSEDWQIAGIFPGTNTDVKITDNQLGIQFSEEFEGNVLHLENRNKVRF